MRLINLGFDCLMGEDLYSLRATLVITCYSIASFFSYWVFIAATLKPWFFAFKAFWIYIVGFFVLGTASIAIKRKRSVLIWEAATIVVLIVGVWEWWEHIFDALYIGWSLGFIFVTLNRKIIRFSSHLSHLVQLLAMVFINTLLGVIYLVPTAIFLRDFKNHTNISSHLFSLTFLFVSAMNLFVAFSALSIAIVILIASPHRLLWPIIQRPIYAIIRRNVVIKPALLLSTAFILLTWSIPAWRPFWEVVGKLK